MPQVIEKKINEIEKDLNKCKFVKSLYPDAKIYSGLIFSSKKINKEFDNFKFNDFGSWIELKLFKNIDYNSENIQIFSNPLQIIVMGRYFIAHENFEIRFSNLNFDLKNDNFIQKYEEMVINFITDNIKRNRTKSLNYKSLDKKVRDSVYEKTKTLRDNFSFISII